MEIGRDSQSTNTMERTVCSWILAGSIQNHKVVAFGDGDGQSLTVADIEKVTKEDTPSIHSVDSKQLYSPLSAFAGVDDTPSLLLSDSYPFCFEFHSYSSVANQDLEFCIHAISSQAMDALCPVPAFDRPSLQITPSTEDVQISSDHQPQFEFLSPLRPTSSFIYIPIHKNDSERLRKIITLSASQPLSETEVQLVGVVRRIKLQLADSIDEYKRVIQNIVKNNALITSTRLRGIMQFNPMIALDIIRGYLSTQRKQQILDIVFQSPISVSLLHIVSQLMGNESIPKSYFQSFMGRVLKSLESLKDVSQQVSTSSESEKQTHLVQCFSFFLAGLYKRRVVDIEVVPFRVVLCIECEQYMCKAQREFWQCG